MPRWRGRVLRNSIRFLAGADLDDALDEDAGRVDVVGIELADRHQLLDLGDGDLRRRSPSSD